MSKLSQRTLYWAPRALSILFICFLSLFALDVFESQLGFWQTVQALLMHLIPSFVLIVALALAWRWEWIGTVVYAAGGLLYVGMVMTMSRPITPMMRLTWILMISGPAFVIAGLFMANWLRRPRQRLQS